MTIPNKYEQTEDEEVKLRYGFPESPGRCDPDKCSFSKWASEGEVNGISQVAKTRCRRDGQGV